MADRIEWLHLVTRLADGPTALLFCKVLLTEIESNGNRECRQGENPAPRG